MKYNARIAYTKENGLIAKFYLWVNEYSQAHAVGGSNAQSKMFQHFYPKNYSPGTVSVIGRVRDLHTYERLGEFIRAHQITILQGPPRVANIGSIDNQIPLMSLSIPDENYYIEGWIQPFIAGTKRFNVAPEFRFEFFVVKDQHSSNELVRPLYTVHRLWNGDFIDNQPPAIEDTVDIFHHDRGN